jgi:hypothetical protein
MLPLMLYVPAAKYTTWPAGQEDIAELIWASVELGVSVA